MFDITKNLDNRVLANKLKKGDLVVIHNPFILKDTNKSNLHYGPGVVVQVIQSRNFGPEDAVEVEVLLANETKTLLFWGTLWHFYRM